MEHPRAEDDGFRVLHVEKLCCGKLVAELEDLFREILDHHILGEVTSRLPPLPLEKRWAVESIPLQDLLLGGKRSGVTHDSDDEDSCCLKDVRGLVSTKLNTLTLFFSGPTQFASDRIAIASIY